MTLRKHRQLFPQLAPSGIVSTVGTVVKSSAYGHAKSMTKTKANDKDTNTLNFKLCIHKAPSMCCRNSLDISVCVHTKTKKHKHKHKDTNTQTQKKNTNTHTKTKKHKHKHKHKDKKTAVKSVTIE